MELNAVPGFRKCAAIFLRNAVNAGTIDLGYLVHDLSDAAVARRGQMFQLGNAHVKMAGLTRGSVPAFSFLDRAPLVLGKSEDARLGQRAGQIVRIAVAELAHLAEHFGRLDVLVARNLEMLLVAVRLLPRMQPRPRLVYECLDIHRLLTAPGLVGAMLRRLEHRLGRSVDLVLTSSPAFVDNHLGRGSCAGQIVLVENKVLVMEEAQAPALPTPPGPPWRIGWFGALRCRRSFEMLAGLARRAEGRVEIVIRGRPSPAVFPDLPVEVAAAPGVSFHGPYDNARDLGRIYADVHFAWCVDFYEEGRNSTWLLPNRLYESGYHRTPPIALASVETGRFLARHGFGLSLEEADAGALEARLAGMDRSCYAEQVKRISRLPRSLWATDRSDCAALVTTLVRARDGVAA